MGIKPITRTLAMLQQGAFVDQCSDLMANIVRAVPPTGGRGRYAVTVLRAGMTPAQAIAYLEAMQ